MAVLLIDMYNKILSSPYSNGENRTTKKFWTLGFRFCSFCSGAPVTKCENIFLFTNYFFFSAISVDWKKFCFFFTNVIPYDALLS